MHATEYCDAPCALTAFENSDKTFYRCFVQISEISLLGGVWKPWKTGWIEANKIELSSRKWYEN